ncbi:hypothetical protein TIFTF001_020669 [Ficus carica]|uniref:AP-5 complex subunit zeta-1 n=1 Tax=Ficus carica TaxID=3494 RepID=A0AA88AY85_FICCA|nr:hypothetical protein TIFTF001_020669 [Ficus carica]
MDGRSREWDIHLRTLSSSARDSTIASDPASDSSLLISVKKLQELCKDENSENLVARVYPLINKLFQRSVASLSQSRTSNGLLLLAILQFYLDFGDVVLHDADPSLRTFFKTCLSREFADPVVAEATLDFLNANKKKLISSFPTLLPQTSFYDMMIIYHAVLSPVAEADCLEWRKIGEVISESVSWIGIIWVVSSTTSPLSGFAQLVFVLVVALEKLERSSGSLVGNSIASIQKSTAPEMLLALMDEAYTGSTIGDGGGDSESEDSSTIDVADPVFLELLKDENDGLAERHWTSPVMAAALQAAMNTPQSDRLKYTLKMTPRLIDVYFAIALRDANDSLICALIPLLMSRNAVMFPETNFCYEVRKRLLEFMLSAFQRSPGFIAILKKPIMDRLAEAYDNPEKSELALQLCWAIGEHGGGGAPHKDAARELFEGLELLLYENLSSSANGSSSLDVARSRISDVRVWRRARDYLGLMNEPAISLSVLGPSRPSPGQGQNPGTVKWSDGATKMIAHIPFYILGEQEGINPFL